VHHHKGTISIAFVAGALEGAAQRGLELDPLLAKAGIPPATLHSPEARVSATAYARLLRLIAQVLDDEFFGQDSRRMKVGSFAMLCRAVVHCRTLESALARTLRFFGLVLDDIGGTLVRDGASVRLTLTERDPRAPARIFAHETLLMFTHRLCCWLVNRRLQPLAASFRYAEPAHGAEYRVLFTPRLRFSQAETCLVLDARLMELAVVRDERALKDFLRLAPDNLLMRYKDDQGVAVHLRRLLRQLPPPDWPSFDAMAESMGVSASTLRRRLDAEGHSYQGIKDRLRRDMAIELLSGTRQSVMAIAAELGFAEASAFHRAFRKWTGFCPGGYRGGPPNNPDSDPGMAFRDGVGYNGD